MPRNPRRILGLVLITVVVAGACSAEADLYSPAPGAIGSTESVTVAPDRSFDPITVNVNLTDTGFDPEIIFLPAGRPVTLILREHGTVEHHYRVKGLVAAELLWMTQPEITEYDLQNLTPAQLLEYGIDVDNLDDPDMEHVLHHLGPTWNPSRDVSPAGIKPVGVEVHGYVSLGAADVLSFFPINTGTFEVEDVLHPEITGKVIVYLPPDSQ